MAERVARGKAAPEETAPRKTKIEEQIEQFNAGLGIDKHALDDELANNPKVFEEIADALALAISRRDAASDEVKEIMAECDQSIRVGFEKEEKKKPAEPQIAQMVILHPDVKAAKARLRNREEDVGRLQAMKESYQVRGYAIKDMVSLHLASYFGHTGGSVRREIDEEGREARHMDIRRQQNRSRENRR